MCPIYINFVKHIFLLFWCFCVTTFTIKRKRLFSWKSPTAAVRVLLTEERNSNENKLDPKPSDHKEHKGKLFMLLTSSQSLPAERESLQQMFNLTWITEPHILNYALSSLPGDANSSSSWSHRTNSLLWICLRWCFPLQHTISHCLGEKWH